jgi:ABC-type uncharacterized transport system substrate-binding protein
MSHTMAGTALVGFFRRSLPPLVLLLLLALPDRGHAHPHVFVAYSFDLVFGADGLDGVRMTWEFDDFFSSLLLQTYDANGDGRFSPEETQRLEREQFAGLRGFDYNIELFLNGTRANIPAAIDFQASVHERRVAFSFLLPFSPPRPRAGALELIVDDPDYYFAIAYDPRRPARALPPGSGQTTCAKSTERQRYRPLGITCTFHR